mgnify:CR=1 FL=1
MAIDSPPEVLVVHLLRFVPRGERREPLKMNDHVAFDLELELTSGVIYDLKALVEHRGRRTQGGHYVAYAHTVLARFCARLRAP